MAKKNEKVYEVHFAFHGTLSDYIVATSPEDAFNVIKEKIEDSSEFRYLLDNFQSISYLEIQTERSCDTYVEETNEDVDYWRAA